MALHPDFPRSPYEILPPELRWFPAAEELRSTAYEKLLPPLVAKVREEVNAWRDADYAGASATSRALLTWWFETDHLIEQADGTQSQFRYYFAQREAVETVIWLYDVRGVRDKFDLLRFDASGAVSAGMFDEDWPRFVVKMATGAGKTKVLSLLIAWSFFHKLYEPDSTLARNFLVIAPNIIVLDRLRADFDGLRIFFNDPVLPDNGHDGRNWRDDFQLTLHIQDDVRVVRADRQHLPDQHPPRLSRRRAASPRSKTTTCATTSSPRSARSPSARPPTARPTWARSSARSTSWPCSTTRRTTSTTRAWPGSSPSRTSTTGCCRRTCRLALQVDVTATPRHDNGAIFVQTVSDYPLVEAIHQNVVKHPVLPDAASRAKLARAPERHLHREIRRLPAARHRGMAQELRRAREAGQEGRPVRDGGRHPQLRRRRRLPGEDLPRAAGRGAGHPHQEQRRDLRSGLRQEQGGTGSCCASSPTRSTPGHRPTRPSSRC